MIFEQFQILDSLLPAVETFAALYQQADRSPANRLNGWSLDDRDPRTIEQLMPLFDWLYRYYFRVQTDGWEHIPTEGKVLLIGSHNGGMAAPDLHMMVYDWMRRFGTERSVYALMNPTMWQALPGLARLGTRVGAIRAHPKMAIAALHRNASLLIYPGGAQDVFRPYSQRHNIYFYGRRAFVKLALREEVPIIPLISCGAHSTLVVLADIYPQMQQLHELGLPWLFDIDPQVFPVYLGLPWGLAFGPLPNLPLPMPIHTRVCPPIVFERYGIKASQDLDYVEQCYQKVYQIMQSELDQLVQEHGSFC